MRNRVAMLPGEVAALKKMGIEVLVEHHAGEQAFASDKDYQAAGASTLSRKEVISKAEMFLSVNPVPEDDLKSFRKDRYFVPFLIRLRTANGWNVHVFRD